MNKRRCRICNDVKPVSEFRGYRGMICSACKKKRDIANTKKWQDQHPDYQKDYYRAHKEPDRRIPKMIGELRRCGGCEQYKPLKDFGKCKSCPDGLTPNCRQCISEYGKERRRKPTYKPKKRTQTREQRDRKNLLWRERRRKLKLENPDLVKARDREKNGRRSPERNREYVYKGRKQDPAAYCKYMREWKKKNRGKVNAWNRQRENMKRKVEGWHTEEEWQIVLNTNGHRCLRCGTNNDLTKDHVVPVSVGGSDYPNNLQHLCRRCNSAKGDTIADYREKII